MNAKEKHLRCYARSLKLNVLLFQSFWSIQAVILNIHMISEECVLTWKTFPFQDYHYLC